MERSRNLKIASVLALVILAFGLGYLMGKSRTNADLQAASGISPSDMRGAFGSQSPADDTNSGAGNTATSQMPMDGQPRVASLNDLVAGLEKKVAADPGNVDQQILLARTYEELGERFKGVALLRTLHQQHSENADVTFILASFLMQGTDPDELREADKLFGDVARKHPELATMAQSHQREVRDKLGENARR